MIFIFKLNESIGWNSACCCALGHIKAYIYWSANSHISMIKTNKVC